MKNLATKIAREAHKDQKRWGGESYFEAHLLPVAEAVEQYLKYMGPPGSETDGFVVGILHDLLEDTKWTEARLLKAGIPQLLIDKIKLLTREKDSNYTDYIRRIVSSEDIITIAVKMQDIVNNLESLPEEDKYKHKRTKYELALAWLAHSNPLNDCTDWASPAWWRGNDYGCEQSAKIILETLSGKFLKDKPSFGFELFNEIVKKINKLLKK